VAGFREGYKDISGGDIDLDLPDISGEFLELENSSS